MGAAPDSRSVRGNAVALYQACLSHGHRTPLRLPFSTIAGRDVLFIAEPVVRLRFPRHSLITAFPHFSQRITNSHAASLIHGVRSEISFFS